MAQHTMSCKEVAAELQMSERTLRRRWRTLHERQGFPRPLPGVGLVWSKLLVVAWLRGASAGVARPANDDAMASDGGGVDAAALIEAQRQALRASLT